MRLAPRSAFFVFGLATPLWAQQPPAVAQQSLGAPGSFEAFSALTPAADGAWYACGSQMPLGTTIHRPIVARYDRHFVLEWSHSYDPGAGWQPLDAVAVAASSDGGCVVVGTTGSLHDYEVAKFDAAGNSTWQTFAPDPVTTFAALGDLRLDLADRTWIASQSYHYGPAPDRGRLTVLAPDGHSLVERLYDPDAEFQALTGLAVSPQGDVYGVGFAHEINYLPVEFAVARFDLSGNLVWRTTLTSQATHVVGAGADSAFQGSMLIVTGSSSNALPNSACTTAALDANGTVLWRNDFAPAGWRMSGSHCAVAPGGEIAVVGTAIDSSAQSHVLVLRLDAAGATQWWTAIPVSEGGTATDVALDPSGAVVVSLVTDPSSAASPFEIRRFAAGGALEWTYVSTEPIGRCAALEVDPHGTVVGAGYVKDPAPLWSTDARLVALDDFGRHLYCTAKPSSPGCVPAIDFEGAPQLSSPAPFHVTCENVVNQKNGQLFYGTHGAIAVPFLGGTLCVQPPLRRTPIQASGGNAGPADCSGTFDFDFGARLQSGLDPALVAGTSVQSQYYFRDPPATFGAGLSDAFEFTIAP